MGGRMALKRDGEEIMFPKSTGRRSHHETTIEYDGEIIHVEWVAFEDILIPENREIIDKTIISVTPNKYRFLGDEYLLDLCEEEERRNNVDKEERKNAE